MARLIIFDDQVRGIDLPDSPVIIGRSKKSDIPIRDSILSRKHCAILPNGSGYRLVDLKSSNGTYLNGCRVDRKDLSYDDVIEIGNTVIAFLDPGVWSCGEGLVQLRNPAKAQELIQKIRLNEEEKKKIPVRSVTRTRRAPERTRDLLRTFPVIERDPEGKNGGEGEPIPDGVLDLLVEFSVHKTVSSMVRNRPRLGRLISEAIETALISVVSGRWEDFRPRLREELRKRLITSAEEDTSDAE